MPNNQPIKTISTLYSNIKNIIDTSKHEVAVTINSTMILAYWEIGRHLRELERIDILESIKIGRSKFFVNKQLFHILKKGI